ncbi:CP family cyanate transporter-like MFS transporter [Aminobacter aminovorans]|uniref:Inner membrane transport protein YeaN n=1 Tax=Aminobacter aminovorans TaxID=83263 RepID=A0A380WHL4_AMIAI|nr:cyanate transporter [Aminobacter aminovorans]TCS27099.1 CP family cyanate transporter-like MFS transporter [Aminobacter aminovorans]SUU87842.1 Inner membrane transport protein YeaN [Aminobacter aminovorans]
MDKTKTAWVNQAWTMLALVVMIGVNLRPFITAPATLLPSIVADTGMGYAGISLLTLLPMALMGIGAFVAPAIQTVVGTRQGLLAALALLMAGSLLRFAAFDGDMMIMTAILCGAGVAFVQAVFPGIIKARFPASVPTVTGLYSAMIMGGGAVGARLMPVLANAGYSWRAALAWLAAPVFVALLAAFRILAPAKAPGLARPMTRLLLLRPRTWALIAAFGLVNSGYSSMVAWLAPYYQAQGWTGSQSSNLVAIMALCQAVSAFGLPFLARGACDRRPWLLFTAAVQLVGFLGLASFPAPYAWLWVALCGVGLGGSFALAMITALDHLPQPDQAGALAAAMQGGGFLIAALGPYAMAMLHGFSESFATGWVMHAILVAASALLYVRFDPSRYGEVMKPIEAHRPSPSATT